MEADSLEASPFLSASFQALLDWLKSEDLVKYVGEGHVREELKKWETMLRMIDAVLEDADDKLSTNTFIKEWLSDLHHLAYDIEDVLDELNTDALRRMLVAESASTVKFNEEILSKISGITARLAELVDQKTKLSLLVGVSRRRVEENKRLPSTSLVDAKKVYGREKDVDALLDLVNGEGSDDISVIPIVGMGGIGKTTLAKLVFDRLEFDLKAWVSVGEDFDVIRVTTTILQALGNQPQSSDLNILQVNVKEKLSGKRFLIVLDDVWNKKYEGWTVLSAPFNVGGSGSKIIVTTRDGDIASMMGTCAAYNLKELSEGDCLSVFAQHALGVHNFDSHSHLKELGEEIVKRCHGLPLAAKALGGVLRGRRHRAAWEKVLRSKEWEENGQILPSLRLSYNHLPSHLKQCFAYCAIFSKDYEFDKDQLVSLWMAEGFSRHPIPVTRVELLEEYFDNLLSRSFFQPFSGQKSMYVMHDLMHDLARSVSKDLCFNLDDMSSTATSCAKIHHATFTPHKYDVVQRFKVFDEMKKLRTFLSLSRASYDDCYLSNTVLVDIVPKLTCLRSLSLAGYKLKELPSSIGNLKLLRLLSLSGAEIETLPDTIGELINLQTLSMPRCSKLMELPMSIGELINLQTLALQHCCNLAELPNSIGKLINLQHLNIEGTDKLLHLPPQIVNLVSLKTLPKFIVGRIHEGPHLSELKKLSSLQGKLLIQGLHSLAAVRDAQLANLKLKDKLNEIGFRWSDDSCAIDEFIVLESLQPHQNLEQLSILCYGCVKFPSWVGDPSFARIMSLSIADCRKITTLPALGQLPLLQDLVIEDLTSVKEMGVELYGGDGSTSVGVFPSLEILWISNMLEWEQWHGDDLDEEPLCRFPKLRELIIDRCPKLVGKLPSSLPSLHRLYLRRCNAVILQRVLYLPSLKELSLYNINGLVQLPEELVQGLVRVEEVTIENCNELKYLWEDGSTSKLLCCLKKLEICSCKQLVRLVKQEMGLLPASLQVLHVSNCDNLEKLPNNLNVATSLGEIHIKYCRKLMSLGSAMLQPNLKSLVVGDCDSLMSIPTQIVENDISHLEDLEIVECDSLTCLSVDNFQNSLKTLTTSHVTLELIESLRSFSLLTHLIIIDCPTIESLPERGLEIPTLQFLQIWNCKKLKSLPNHMQNLTSVMDLTIGQCERLVSLPPEGGLPPNLAEFRIVNCEKFRQPILEWGLYALSSLKSLHIRGICQDLNSFPGEGPLLPNSLKEVSISGMKNLEHITKEINNLTSLQKLYLSDCPKLQSLPKEGLPDTLGSFEGVNCPELAKKCERGKGKTSTLPAFFVFERAHVDVGGCVEALLGCHSSRGKPIMVLFGLEYSNAIPRIREQLVANGSNSNFEFQFADTMSSIMTLPRMRVHPMGFLHLLKAVAMIV